MRLTHHLNVTGVDLTVECLHTVNPVSGEEKLSVSVDWDDAPYSSQIVVHRHCDGEGKEF